MLTRVDETSKGPYKLAKEFPEVTVEQIKCALKQRGGSQRRMYEMCTDVER